MKVSLLNLLLLPVAVMAAPDPASDQAAFEEADAGPWKEVFVDQGTGDWQENWFLDGEIAAVENSERGMELRAGPRASENAHHMVLWTKQSFEGDLKIEYDYMRTDFATAGVTMIYIQATGSGKGPHAKDIAEWSELRRIPTMGTYLNHMHLYHLSYAAFEPKTGQYIRGRRYMPETGRGLEGTELQPEYLYEEFFKPGEWHRITVIKHDRQLFFRISNERETLYGAMKNPELPPIVGGRVGFRHMWTRSALYRDIRISVPGD
jgi:hypothetical protein